MIKYTELFVFRVLTDLLIWFLIQNTYIEKKIYRCIIMAGQVFDWSHLFLKKYTNILVDY